MKKINNQWYTDKQYIDLLEKRIQEIKERANDIEEYCEYQANIIKSAVKLIEEALDEENSEKVSDALDILTERKWK